MEERFVEIIVKPLEDNEVRVSVTVEASVVDATIKATYKDLAFKYNFPGFRKGKAPRRVIDNALGAEFALVNATDTVVNDAYPLAIEEKKISPVGQPEFGEPSLVVAGEDFTFSFLIHVKPEFELSSYDPIEIELPFEEVTEAEIEEQVKSMLEHYSTFENASAATKIKPENNAELTIKATDAEGNTLEALEGEARLFAPASGMYPEAFDAEVLGMKKGQTKEFSLEIAADDDSILLKGLAGQTVNFTITCNVVKKKVVAELTDEWVSETIGFDSVDAFKEAISASLAAQKAQVLPNLKENNCALKLIERFEGEAPAAMVEENETVLLQEFFTQLQRQGMNFDAYLKQAGISSDQFKADVKLQAIDEVKQKLALDAWARHFEIEATPEEVSHEFVIAGLDDPKAVEEEWRKSGRLHLIREGIVRSKAMDDVLDKAVVTRVDFAAKA